MGKNLLMITVSLLISIVLKGQEAETLLQLADSLYRVGDYEKSSKKYESYFELQDEEIQANQLYKAAVSFSKTGNANKAIHWLQRAVEEGIDDKYLTNIRFDLNFYPIRHTKEWKTFFEKNTAIGFQITLHEYLGGYTPKTKEAYKKIELELQEKYETSLKRGKELLRQNNFEEAADYYKQVMSCNGYIQMEDIYNSARINSMRNTSRSKFQAIWNIRSLAARGFHDLEKLENDPAFENIKEEKNFLEIVEIIKKYNTIDNTQD